MQIVVAIASAMIAGIVAVYLMYFRKRKPAQAKTTKQQVTQPVDEEVLEITEEDINNIRRIPELKQRVQELIQIVELLSSRNNGNGSREVSLFEALAQITKPVPEVPWVMPITQPKPVTHIHKERTPEEKSAWGKRMAEARKAKNNLDKH